MSPSQRRFWSAPRGGASEGLAPCSQMAGDCRSACRQQLQGSAAFQSQRPCMAAPLHRLPCSISHVLPQRCCLAGDPRLSRAPASMHLMLRRLEQGTARSDDASSSVSTRTWTASQPAATPLAVRRLPGPSTPAGLPTTVPARSGLRAGQLLGKAVKLLLIGTAAAVAAVVVTQVAFLSRKAFHMLSGHSLADREAAVAVAGLMCVCADPATASLVRCVWQPVWTSGLLQCLRWHQDTGVWVDPPISAASKLRLAPLKRRPRVIS